MDILFNAKIWNFTTRAKDTESHDLYTVFLHEVGHALGLRHLKGVPSVMRPQFMPSESMRTPSSHDREHIREIYGDGGLLKGAIPRGGRRRREKRDVTSYGEEELERTILSLSSQGECRHYRDGRLILRHKLR